MSEQASIEVAHGYTCRDLDRLARIAVRIANLHSLPAGDRYDEALSAIGLALAAAAEPPTERELKAAGARAVNEMHRVDDHHHGVDPANRYAGREGMRRYQAYWALAGVTPSHEDRVVDRIALEQVWPALSPMQKAALTAYAEHGDHDAATAAVGVAPGTYKVHIKRGRDKVFALWHEGESPSRIWFVSRGGSSSLARVLVARRRYRADRERAGVAA